MEFHRTFSGDHPGPDSCWATPGCGNVRFAKASADSAKFSRIRYAKLLQFVRLHSWLKGFRGCCWFELSILALLLPPCGSNFGNLSRHAVDDLIRIHSRPKILSFRFSHRGRGICFGSSDHARSPDHGDHPILPLTKLLNYQSCLTHSSLSALFGSTPAARLAG